MARRRLTPLPAGPFGTEVVPRAERSDDRPLAMAPIAHVAGESAALSAFEEVAETLRAARESGRMVLDLPLDEVAADHLVRDRLPAEDEEMAALRASICAHGQRTPIEVTPLAGPLPYGLISGWRRLVALKALHAETGEARFAAIRALVTRPEDAGSAYVAMVEENEIRVGLSQYERARIALLAAGRGVFADEEEALRQLFAGASKAKLSRIRSFMEIVRALDDVLRFPQSLPERLGLDLVKRIRDGGRDLVVAALSDADPRSQEDELALLQALVAPKAGRAEDRSAEEVRPGVVLETRQRGEAVTLTLKGRGVSPELAAEIRAVLARSDA